MKVFIIEQIDDGEKLEKLISLVKNNASKLGNKGKLC